MESITAELTAGTRVILDDGRHRWTADEPEDAGGEDAGPNPWELLLGSLAACTAITLRLYCRHKGIELRSVRAVYRRERPEEGGDGPADRIVSEVTIDADVDESQRERLTQIVSRCPVHRTLEAGVDTEDRVEFT